MKRTSSWILVCLSAIIGSCAEVEPRSAPNRVPTRTVSEERNRCQYPTLRPTYLPWESSSEIPEPRRSYDKEIDRAQLSWMNPDNPQDGVGLTVYPLDRVGSSEEPIGVRIRGEPGYLHRGSVGEHSAWWDLDERCNFLELSVSLEGMSPKTVDKEVIKVARSLKE